MLRSPGSARVARPHVPEEIELKVALLGGKLEWSPALRAFAIGFPGQPILGATYNIGVIEARGWDRILSEIADALVKARVPVGHLSGLNKIEPVVIEAAAVIDEENFK